MHEVDRFAHLDDWELYRKAMDKGADSQPAANKLYRIHFSDLRKFFGCELGNWATADDMTHEVFRRLFQKMHYQQNNARFSAFLNGIARKICLEHIRKNRVPIISIETMTREPIAPAEYNVANRFALQELAKFANSREKRPPDSLAFPLAMLRRRVADVKPKQSPLVRQQGRAFAGPDVFRRYLWLKWWSQRK